MMIKVVFLVFTALNSCSHVHGASSCPAYAVQPKTLLANESSCHIRSGQDTGCYDCCPLDWNCCDDGSCMHYDTFCRYPKTCCKETYCGNQCCSPAHGVPCGPLCAPLAYTCCNSTDGQLCKGLKPDTCCGDHCCPDTHFCCSSDKICCEKGTTCCPGENGKSKCCPPGTECCGDHCCPKEAHEQCATGEVCCPEGRTCPDHLCCPVGQFCPSDANVCCDNQWCDSTKRCCHKGNYCNQEGGCCANGQTFCTGGQIDNCFSPPFDHCCSDGGACTSTYPLCRGDYCCQYSYPKLCESQRLCHGDNGGNCQCCGSDRCCYPPYSCDGGDCKHCYKKGHWWWRHTVCDQQGNSVSHAQPLERPHLSNKKGQAEHRKKDGCNFDASRTFISKIRARRHMLPPLKRGKFVSPASGSVKTGVVLPPAPTHILNPDSYACFRDQQGMKDTCKAFACMVQMTDCGSTGYLKEAIALYCDGINQYRNLFNSKGQTFLTCLQTCVTTAHVAIFQQGIIPCCSSFEAWGDGTMQEDCFLNCGFCNVFLANAGAFDTLFNNDGSMNIYTLYFKYCHIGEEGQLTK